MKKIFNKGEFVLSMAGHDRNHYYIIIEADEEYVYIVDGVHKLIEKPKKKKNKHVQIIHKCDEQIAQKILKQEEIMNEDIVAAIARYETGILKPEEGK